MSLSLSLCITLLFLFPTFQILCFFPHTLLGVTEKQVTPSSSALRFQSNVSWFEPSLTATKSYPQALSTKHGLPVKKPPQTQSPNSLLQFHFRHANRKTWTWRCSDGNPIQHVQAETALETNTNPTKRHHHTKPSPLCSYNTPLSFLQTPNCTRTQTQTQTQTQIQLNFNSTQRTLPRFPPPQLEPIMMQSRQNSPKITKNSQKFRKNQKNSEK